MSYSYELNELDMRLATLPWQVDGDNLILGGQTANVIRSLMIIEPSVATRIAMMAHRIGLSYAKLVSSRLNKTKTMSIPASAAFYNQPGTKTMQRELTKPEPGKSFIWYSGLINEETRPIIDRMESTPTPIGLVLPVVQSGVLKTIQMGINYPSIKVFGFEESSREDMMAAIMRDTTNDWYGPDLDIKRQKYKQEGTRWEQVARIKDKSGGFFIMRFQCERLDYGDYVLSSGTKESEVVEAPELLRV